LLTAITGRPGFTFCAPRSEVPVGRSEVTPGAVMSRRSLRARGITLFGAGRGAGGGMAGTAAVDTADRPCCVGARLREKLRLQPRQAWPMYIVGRLGSMSRVELPRVIHDRPGRPDWGDAAHPIRELTRAIAVGASAWTRERRAQIATLFDSLASGWRDRDVPERHDALVAVPERMVRGGRLRNR
jgi:hypothetical protein